MQMKKVFKLRNEFLEVGHLDRTWQGWERNSGLSAVHALAFIYQPK